MKKKQTHLFNEKFIQLLHAVYLETGIRKNVAVEKGAEEYILKNFEHTQAVQNYIKSLEE